MSRPARAADRVEPAEPAASGTVHRAIRVMAVFAEAEGPLGVSEVAARLALPVSTTHRLLKLLGEEGIVERDAATQTYHVGAELYRLAACITANTPIAQVGQRHIDALAATLDETVALRLYLPERAAMAFVARSDGSHPLQYRIELNRPLPLVWGSSGKAILAFLPDERVAEVVARSQPSPTTGRAPPAPAALSRALAAIRQAGHAATVNEKVPGAHGLAVPVFGPRGVIGSLCITAPAERARKLEQPRTLQQLKDCAARLSTDLGADPGTVAGTGRAR